MLHLVPAIRTFFFVIARNFQLYLETKSPIGVCYIFI